MSLQSDDRVENVVFIFCLVIMFVPHTSEQVDVKSKCKMLAELGKKIDGVLEEEVTTF